VEAATQGSANLSDANVARRLRAGIVLLALALAVAAVLEARSASHLSRLALFPLLFVAANAFFQAIYRTCGFSAWRGFRHTVEGEERIADPHALRLSRARGRKQLIHALLSALALTGLLVWLSN
jgi:hypothetical protein